MAVIKLIWDCMFSPRLHAVFSNGKLQSLYEANRLERWGDQVINSLYIMWNIGVYTSPVIATILYKKGYFVVDGFLFMTKVLTGLGIILATSYCIRAIGRVNNNVYLNFTQTLSQVKNNLNKDTKKHLSQYDFEFFDWPVEFKWNDLEGDDTKQRLYVERPSARGTAIDSLISLPCKLISYAVAHSFGIKMVYPGSLRTLQALMFPVILQGRIKLIEEFNGVRYKLRTRDENDIDTIFIDRRHKHSNGSTLVICCEGNAGFYELGIMMTPIEANYSVVGWNHPGFGGSTGLPYPSQEQNAIDCVIQFAIHHLGFQAEDILLFGWSIGGYSSSWAAMNYPDIKGVVLDATFDDILPLAIPRMPTSFKPIVRRTIRDYINLNVAQQINKYNGPVLFVRRTEDEIICTQEGNLSTNRGNHLVSMFLRYRYPKIYDEERLQVLDQWLASDQLQQSLMWDQNHINKDVCASHLVSYIEDNSLTYPMQVGDGFSSELKQQMAIYLADKYLKSYRSTHCTPLPVSMFRLPWSPVQYDSSFVKL